jgi:hypothetical protein
MYKEWKETAPRLNIFQGNEKSYIPNMNHMTKYYVCDIVINLKSTNAGNRSEAFPLKYRLPGLNKTLDI